MFRRILGVPLAFGLAVLAGAVTAQPAFVAPMDVPAPASALALKAPLNALVVAGQRLVVAGQRGHILYSDDGQSWTQAAVPVSSDLNALAFPNPQQGWAVGHEGVILHSADGGHSWTRQLDGPRIAELLQRQYGRPANPDDPDAARLQHEAELAVAQGADKPLLDVWFEDDKRGYAIGAFNLILRTEDGGQHWTPWLDRVENPRGMHLYAMRPAAGTLFMVGEQGLVLKFDARQQRFRALELPYQGTLFGIVGTPEVVLVYGLRGNALRSTDGGASWHKVQTGTDAGLNTGTVLADGSIVLGSQSGELLRSTDQGASFHPLKVARAAPNFAVAAAPGAKVALVGLGGVRLESLQ
ncbi:MULTISPECIES: WD40/YVTN/BNR-like repeat-containing protein [Pseudomonas aeruginosa group]|uniref:WD40/YVTN/BNR-like repeat-containing protein n=1 Tax=Pseudomonas aeruginosa group TaxID=136841 RepID=UPI0005BC945C|nr:MULTISPECIES: YCF48-related protein [Pseudomonas aeruginosa group]VTS14904.1 Ycf48-like protein [Streptococcus dysgalactiae subsp. equisimilis]KRU85364.1 glycosyl hydrolase [Pseudomonas aeruginosa]MBG7007748.1 glycosyl hydrolase [Pseudomonas aeruginosa]MBG7027171.1 glycosyl hydrolase [Pseudomonas aeruginosa]MBG7372709.1 glycosyl hydrolase [Pseudomonas aeruginosa]